MEIAIWIIAICELVRLVQNTIQLFMMRDSRQDRYMKTATDAFVKSLSKTDAEFVQDILEKIGEGQCGKDAERYFQNSDHWNDYLAKVIADAKADERERILGMVDWKQQEDLRRGKLVIEIDYADALNGEQVASIICEKLKEQKND